MRRPAIITALIGVLTATTGAATLLAAGPASATPPSTLNATFHNSSAVTTSFRQADGNTFISQVVQVTYTGDISGPVTENIDITIHPDGTLNANGTDVCNCTLTATGQSGTITSPFTATGSVITGAVSGNFTFGDGTGGLANLHAVGTFTSTDGGNSGTFTALYHFDP